MKKLLALLLAAAMCFSLVACGGGETPNTDDNSSMQQETENNNDVENNDTTANETTTPTITFGVSDSKYADHQYLSDVFGTWVFKENFATSEYTMYKTLTLNEDGTCVVDGENANWKIEDSDTSENTLYIGIYKNSEIVYAATFQMDSNYGLVLWPVYRQDGAYTQPNNYVLFTKSEN